MAKSMFIPAVEKIEAKYSQLDAGLGWRFLYTPASTLTCPNGTFFAGINPGGNQYGVTRSVEEGNAYLIESWSENGRSKLQSQVISLFSLLHEAGAIPGETTETALNRTLTTNFCPFRAPSWSKLPQRAAATSFSRDLWSWLLPEIRPSRIICMGTVSYHQFCKILGGVGTQASERKWPTGWGNVRFKARVYDAWEAQVLVVFVPHLSRFTLFGREESEPHVEKLAGLLNRKGLR